MIKLDKLTKVAKVFEKLASEIEDEDYVSNKVDYEDCVKSGKHLSSLDDMDCCSHCEYPYDYSRCKECGFDHVSEADEADAFHLEKGIPHENLPEDSVEDLSEFSLEGSADEQSYFDDEDSVDF